MIKSEGDCNIPAAAICFSCTGMPTLPKSRVALALKGDMMRSLGRLPMPVMTGRGWA